MASFKINKEVLLEKFEELPEDFSVDALFTQLKEVAANQPSSSHSDNSKTEEETGEIHEEASSVNYQEVILEKLLMLPDDGTPVQIMAKLMEAFDFSWKEQMAMLVKTVLDVDLLEGAEQEGADEEKTILQKLVVEWKTFRWQDGDLADRLEASAKELAASLNTEKAKGLLEKFTAQL